MINFIKYTIDGVTYTLVNNGDNTWNRDENAPNASGNYQMTLTIIEDGNITNLDASDDIYEMYLDILTGTEKNTQLGSYVPDFISDTTEIASVFNAENDLLDHLGDEISKIKSNHFITTASNYSISRMESFLGMKGLGTLEQRKSYLISLNQKGNKLNVPAIRNIVKSIAGSDCIVTFFGAEEESNPDKAYGLLKIQVLSPDSTKNYRYADIARALAPLVPSHIKLSVIKYFATWGDILNDFSDWSSLSSREDWQVVREYIPSS
ncbi:DUF2313 domain-containing protein [Anoxybacterium hadale]|uniref:DUF2313 domain-containing protein n=1 Tax=Anoxybacterium hadale TaxID=3408580 RepID=A0ACD1AB15_9FIRM|nr:DUF2313 domain-containing protein [Clostridiales bacterium]